MGYGGQKNDFMLLDLGIAKPLRAFNYDKIDVSFATVTHRLLSRVLIKEKRTELRNILSPPRIKILTMALFSPPPALRVHS